MANCFLLKIKYNINDDTIRNVMFIVLFLLIILVSWKRVFLEGYMLDKNTLV